MKLFIITYFIFFFFGVSASPSFPTSWWENPTISISEVPSWEILPTSGKRGVSVILSKRNELGILSNFSATPILYKGVKYASLEGAWQSMKYPESNQDMRYGQDKLPFSRQEVAGMSGFQAKKAGSLASKLMKKHNVQYVTFSGKKLLYRTKEKGEHYFLIRSLMQAKLRQNIKVKNILKSTGKLILLPDHHTKGAFIPPAWKYYDIWMELRKEL